MYHTDCIDEWLKNHDTCPSCREIVHVDEDVWEPMEPWLEKVYQRLYPTGDWEIM
jgi:Ring finger domain